MILAIDVGTTETAFALMKENYEIVDKGKIDNLELVQYIKQLNDNETYKLVYEDFASYGMPIGKTTMESIKWNGRFIQLCTDLNKFVKVVAILRKDVKINLCGTMKAKDSNIRQALIDRFGVVGIKSNQGFFYGFRADLWSAFAIGCTYLDLSKKK